MSDSIKTVGDADFKTKVKDSNKAVLVNFWAHWSMSSRTIMPALEAVGSECSGVEIYKLDADQNTTVSNEYRVLTLPTLLMFKKGELVDSIVGATTKAVIKNMVIKAVHSGGEA